MDRNNMEFNNYSTPGNFNQFDNGFDSSMYEAPMINPITQYEQAYMYYKYLTQQMDYRIKCKEYEQLNKTK
ncbi:MAG: hypothetical protein IKQ33_04815 [Clostridia bacterium]|nr:hypothetical protein [Clostridia bacterium]